MDVYASQIYRWSQCGNMLAAVSQDYMCEAFVVSRTGLSIEAHQQLTIQRYDALMGLIDESITVMPVLQGYQVSDYILHLLQYGDRLQQGAWVGLGSVCRRNGSPKQVGDIVRAIKAIRPDLRLHGFGLKITALEHQEVRDLLYSSDSMAWNYPTKFDRTLDRMTLAAEYQVKVDKALVGSQVSKYRTKTSGAGNQQGRKGKWRAGKTKAIRVPEAFAERLLRLARQWDREF